MKFLKNKILMITGGTGSFGQMCTKLLLKHNVKKVIIYSRDELKQFEMSIKFNNPKKLRFLFRDEKIPPKSGKLLRKIRNLGTFEFI